MVSVFFFKAHQSEEGQRGSLKPFRYLRGKANLQLLLWDDLYFWELCKILNMTKLAW